jgi:Zn-dependent protease
MVLVHELGHAVTIRRLTGEHTLIIIGWGGLTVSYRQKRPWQQLLISLAGPGAGFLAGLVAWGIAKAIEPNQPLWPPWMIDLGQPTGLLFLNLFIYVCFFWSAFNLIPAIPLDGGKALRAGLVVFGMWPFKARRVTRWIAVGIAGVGAVWLLRERGNTFYWIIVMMIAMAVLDEARVEGW